MINLSNFNILYPTRYVLFAITVHNWDASTMMGIKLGPGMYPINNILECGYVYSFENPKFL